MNVSPDTPNILPTALLQREGEPGPLAASLLAELPGNPCVPEKSPAARGEVEERQQHLGYWRTLVADAPMRLPLPADRLKPAGLGALTGEFRFEIDGDLTQALS